MRYYHRGVAIGFKIVITATSFILGHKAGYDVGLQRGITLHYINIYCSTKSDEFAQNKLIIRIQFNTMVESDVRSGDYFAYLINLQRLVIVLLLELNKFPSFNIFGRSVNLAGIYCDLKSL